MIHWAWLILANLIGIGIGAKIMGAYYGHQLEGIKDEIDALNVKAKELEEKANARTKGNKEV